MLRSRRLRLAIAAVGLSIGGLGLTGCHKPPDVACQYFARPNHRVFEAWWYQDRSAYYCRSENSTGVTDTFLVRERGDSWWRVD